MYSLAALPSSSRAAPAKKRRLSTTTGTSSIAAPTGLPALRLSSRPISSPRASIASASLRRAFDRSPGVAAPHAGNAFAAAWTARSTSSAALLGTFAITWSLAGLITSSVSPDALSAHSPPMNCWYVLTASSVSVMAGLLRWRRRPGEAGPQGWIEDGPAIVPPSAGHVAPTGSPSHAAGQAWLARTPSRLIVRDARHHGMARRSVMTTTPYRATLSAAVSRIAANTRSVRKERWLSCIQIPSPSVAPTYSPITAATTAYVAEIRRPVKNPGRPDGQRTFRNVWPVDAPNERISSAASAGVEANPSSNAIVIGKKVTSTTTRTFGTSPNPNQTTMSGAIATIGTVCDPTSNGSTARRAHATRSRAIATAAAPRIEMPNPTPVSTIVGMEWRIASERNSQSAPSTWVGAGSTNGLTPDERAYSSQPPSTMATRATGGPKRRTLPSAACPALTITAGSGS